MQTYEKQKSLPIMKPVTRGAQGLNLPWKNFCTPPKKNVLDIV